MSGIPNCNDVEREVQSLLTKQLAELPTCLDCMYRPVHEDFRVFECIDFLREWYFGIYHPLIFGNKTVLISEMQALDEFGRQAFRLPDDRFQPLPAALKSLLGFDHLGTAYQDCRLDYQTVYDRVMPDLRKTEHGFHFCELIDRAPHRIPDLMVRIWRRDYVGLPAPDNSADWDPYPAPECRWETNDFWLTWRKLSFLLPAPLSYGVSDSSYHYVSADEGHYSVHLCWDVGADAHIIDDIGYMVLCPYGLTAAEQRIWPGPQPLPSDQGAGWDETA